MLDSIHDKTSQFEDSSGLSSEIQTTVSEPLPPLHILQCDVTLIHCHGVLDIIPHYTAVEYYTWSVRLKCGTPK